MQLDMHYHGTYAMARAAGINADTAEIIATAAQFVDDNACGDSILFKDGGRFYTEATAHHPANGANLCLKDQRFVWIPFHFLPGDEGKTYTEKLICHQDSANVRALVQHALDLSRGCAFAPELIGLTAHVYADTFSHYDFSGVSSRWNELTPNSLDILNIDLPDGMKTYIEDKSEKFLKRYFKEIKSLDNIIGWFAQGASGGLGHGGASTYPDRPYLKWGFTRKRDGLRIEHDNPATFLKGCEALHGMFSRFAELHPERTTDKAMAFADIREPVMEVLSTATPLQGRIDAWQQAFRAGAITGQSEVIRPYSDDGWNDEREALNRTESSFDAAQSHAYRFYQAAAALRIFILRQLLPTQGLIVA